MAKEILDKAAVYEMDAVMAQLNQRGHNSMLLMDCHGDAVQIIKVNSNAQDMATFTFSICRGLYAFLQGIQHGREPDYGDIDDFADMIGSTMRGIKEIVDDE